MQGRAGPRSILATAAIVCALSPAAPAAAAHPGPAPVGPGSEAELRADETSALGAEHAAEHAQLRAGQRKAAARWRRLSPAERRDARLAIRADRRRALAVTRQAGGEFPPQEFGSWTVAPFPLRGAAYGIHAALLPTSKILIWSYPAYRLDTGKKPNAGEATLWDPAAGTGAAAFRAVPPLFDLDGDGTVEAVPIYCTGESYLPTGEVLLAGGNLVWPGDDPADAFVDYAGTRNVLTFDPFSETWTRQPDMSTGRWYPSQELLADGRTLIVGGYTERAPGGVNARLTELFEPGRGVGAVGRVSTLSGAKRQAATYPHLFALPDGGVLHAGPTASALLEFDGKPSWRELPDSREDRLGGTATLLPDGRKGSFEVLQTGGFDDVEAAVDAHASTELIDAGAKRPRWKTQAPLNVRRSYHNTVLLPDETLVTIGGGNGNDDVQGSYRTEPGEARPQRQVELWDPGTRSWRLGPPQVEDRTYHSVALLLPDGRVMSAGDDKFPLISTDGGPADDFSRDDTIEIYSPPYLFGDDGSPLTPAQRPQIISMPRRIRYGKEFRVGHATGAGGGPVKRAVLVAPSATTHADDMTQRLVPLRLSDGRGPLELDAPKSARVAPPGWYMVFLLDASGTPSVAEWAQLR